MKDATTLDAVRWSFISTSRTPHGYESFHILHQVDNRAGYAKCQGEYHTVRIQEPGILATNVHESQLSQVRRRSFVSDTETDDFISHHTCSVHWSMRLAKKRK